VRVVVAIGRFPHPDQTFIAGLVRGLLAAGVDAHVLCATSDEADWRRYPRLAALPGIASRIHVHAPRRRPAGAARALAQVATKARAHPRALAGAFGDGVAAAPSRLLEAGALARLRPDVVHFQFGPDARRAAWAGALLDRPVVASLRGYDLNYTALDDPGHYAAMWRQVTAVHCLGEDLWRRALQRGCPPEMPHRLIAPAVGTEWLAPQASDRGDGGATPVVLTVARLHWKKGHEHALGAIAALRDRGLDVAYRIAGAGPHEPAVRACIRDLGLEDRVTLLGSIEHAAIRREQHAADVLLHAAVSEGFCNAVLEAQAAALPVVCSDADGLRENVEHGVTGFVTARRDPAALAQRLEQLLRDPELRRRMGAAGHARAATRFTMDAQVEAFLELYRTAVDAHVTARRAPARRARVR
jgi:colanic acid/amylovoran biosynthesis glycosyltransferase